MDAVRGRRHQQAGSGGVRQTRWRAYVAVGGIVVATLVVLYGPSVNDRMHVRYVCIDAGTGEGCLSLPIFLSSGCPTLICRFEIRAISMTHPHQNPAIRVSGSSTPPQVVSWGGLAERPEVHARWW